MNILMVLSTGTFPPDRRVEREARDLIHEGHRVFLMARRGRGQSRHETYNGIEIIRVPLPFQWKRALADMWYYAVERYSIVWRIIHACRKHKIQAIHVHDLPYAFAATLAGRILKIPVIIDLHEHYTAMLEMAFQSEAYRAFNFLSGILLGLLLKEERWACRRAQKVIVVADEHIDRIESLGVPRDSIITVTNTEDADFFSGLERDPVLLDKFRDRFVILYVGVINAHRGLTYAIDAMPAVRESIPNAQLVLVGDGSDRTVLEREVCEKGLEDLVHFAGYQKFDKLPTWIELSSVGLIPHVSTPHIETTMPNKIFQFMILGRPVIVSSTRPMMRVVADADCGAVFQDRDANSLAEAIVNMRDEADRTRLGENGEKAVLDRYNWKDTVEPLLQVYRVLSD